MNRTHDDATLRAQTQQAALFELLKSGTATAGTAVAFRKIAETAARTMGVRRSSVWLFNADRTVLELADRFDLATERHDSGATLEAARYPSYFHALKWSRAIVAPDARTDPRTGEFADGYLTQMGIVSMMDAAIWHEGRPHGVVCLESVDERRDWAPDEQHFAGSLADIAAAALSHEQLLRTRARAQESQDLMTRTFNAIPDLVAVLRISDHSVVYVNPAFEAYSGLRLADIVGTSKECEGLWEFPDLRGQWIERVAAEGLVRDFEAGLRTAGGEVRPFQLAADRVDIEGEACIVVVGRDVSSRQRHERERREQMRALEHLALHDSLTGLPNRSHLRNCIEESFARKEPAVLLLIDLDHFKEINDTLGHAVGDVLLQSLAGRLREEFRSDGEVARLGGDEFAVFGAGVEGEAAAREMATRALALLGKRFDVEGYRLEIGASVGIAMAPRDATGADGLLRCADVAMYSAKRSRSGYAVYSQAQDPYTAERLTLLSELSGSFRRGEMVVHYQPRVGLAHTRLSGFEALVRWNHPRLGRLPPAQFIPLAELSDVIRPLTLWILGESLRQRREWAEAGHPTRLAVNFSARQLLDDQCPDQIAALLKAERTAPEVLELEITESALIADPEHATATLERIRALGVQIAVDDYGTGYSSLSHLRRLPLHALKIDVSFVRNMLRNDQDRVIVESTVGLAHNLGLGVVAEGIEDEGTLAALRAMGCDEGQGFFIARPMDAQAARRWMRDSPMASG